MTVGVIQMAATFVGSPSRFVAPTRFDLQRPATDPLAKPLLRGRLHQLCALACPPAGLRLVLNADSNGRVAAILYAVTWAAMFSASAGYHRGAHSAVARHWMRRLDHSMIFVHIGGTASALALLSLSPLATTLVLGATWAGVLGGVVVKFTRLRDGGSAGSWMYAAVAVAQAAAFPLISLSLSPGQIALLIASGLAYGIGAVLFFKQRLDLAPAVFGYHEVWHCFTVVGGLCQYLLISQLVH